MYLIDMFDATVRKFPDKPALIFGDQQLTYAELDEASRQAAAALRAAGVAPRGNVGVMTYNTPGFVIAALGIWRAGAVLVPINHKLSSGEVGYIATHSIIKVGIVAAELADTARTASPDVTWLTTNDDRTGSFDTAVRDAVPWQGVEGAETDIAEILYTSGTVSRPKGCVHTHRGIATVATYTSITVGLSRDDRFLIAMPIWHSSPLNNWFISMLFLGGSTVLMKEYHPIGFLQEIEKHGVTAFFGAPIAYLAPIQAAKAQGIALSDFDLSTMRVWAYGGAPIGAETARMLQQVYGSPTFYQVYGMTEMGPVGTALYPEEQIAHAGAVGAAGMPGVDLRVVKADGSDARRGETGEVWMRSDTRMVGYLDDSAATAEAFADEWYRTGDLARVDDDGYLFIVDRLTDIIITGGEKVYSPEVEEALLQHPAVADAAAIARPHAEWGETVVAVIVLAPDTAALTLDELREFLSVRLAKYKMPRELVISEALPRNASGKIRKSALREALGSS